MRKTFYLAVTGVALLSACAQPPSAIAPAYVGTGYDNVPCGNVQQMLAQERQTLSALEARQQNAVIQDAATVFLVLVPTSSLTGSNVAGEVAISKGRVLALETRAAACG